MLKPEVEQSQIKVDGAAAFGRLCVETVKIAMSLSHLPDAAAFGRLCVETHKSDIALV